MRTPLYNSIRDRLSSGDVSNRFLWGASTEVSLGELLCGTSLGGRLRELSGRSVLLVTQDQIAAALALIELDGIAKRIVVCTPDVAPEQLPAVIAKGAVDTIVSDVHGTWQVGDLPHVAAEVAGGRATEWVLLTSGTSGSPKMIVHTLASLMAPIDVKQGEARGVVWGTFYDIRRYGGLQIFLRAILGRGSLVLSQSGEPVANHLARLGVHGVTHLSGTPSHWRRALMSPLARAIAPRYVRLSGEIADQRILNTLRSFYPKSSIAHAFASTEAGVAFEVTDGLAGFPASVLRTRGEVEIRVRNDALQIRSNRAAARYLDEENGTLADEEGFIDTGDIVERRGDRFFFLGRRNGVINVGGLKVYPEEVEAVINRHPAVHMSVVRSRKNPLTGALVSADVVLKLADEPDSSADFQSEILEICRQSLAPHKIPVTIRSVPALTVADAGKLVRHHA